MFFDVAMQTGRADVKSLKDLLASIKPTPNSTLDHSAESSGRRKVSKKHGSQSSNDTLIEETIHALEDYARNNRKWPDFTSTSLEKAIRTPRLNPRVRNDWGGFDANRLYTLLESVTQRDLEPDIWLEDLAKKVPELRTNIHETFMRSTRIKSKKKNCKQLS